jgi:hypothetical protein
VQPSHVSLACNGCFTRLNICTYSASAVHVGYSVVLPHVALCHPCRVMAAAPRGLQSMHPCFPFLQRNLCAGFTLQDLEDSLADKARWQETASKSALQWNRARTCWFVTTVHAANHPGQAWRRCCSLMLLCSQTARHQLVKHDGTDPFAAPWLTRVRVCRCISAGGNARPRAQL